MVASDFPARFVVLVSVRFRHHFADFEGALQPVAVIEEVIALVGELAVGAAACCAREGVGAGGRTVEGCMEEEREEREIVEEHVAGCRRGYV